MQTLTNLLADLEPLTLSLLGGELTQRMTGVSTDTRRVKPGDVFFALKGERFDGHDYVAAALEAGAVCAVVERALEVDIPQIVVTDTGEAYGLAAAGWRARFDIPVVAVVGSNGKTTTTQWLGHVLKESLGEEAVLVTAGNFNNDVGLPHMLWQLRDIHQVAVLEAGINHPGEMARLTAWLQPTAVLLTNAQREHQEFLAGVKESARENGLMIVGLEADGFAVYPKDDEGFAVWDDLVRARGVDGLTVSLKAEDNAYLTGALSGNDLTLATQDGEEGQVRLKLSGEHNAHNALGVALTALALGVPFDAVLSGLGSFEALAGRGARFTNRAQTLTVIDDAYNANPDSVAASMRVLSALSGPKLYVLGDMAEVGETADAEHRAAGKLASTLGFDALWTFGDKARLAGEAFSGPTRHFASLDDLVDALVTEQGTVTLKSSHGTGLHNAVRALKAHPTFL